MAHAQLNAVDDHQHCDDCDHRSISLIHSDNVIEVPSGSSPDYNTNNPLVKLLANVEQVSMAAELQHYLVNTMQYLYPYSHLELYGPQGNDSKNLDPTTQDNKTDFQKQNIKDFVLTDTFLTRGWATAGDWTGPYIKLSYEGGPDTLLSQAANGALGNTIKVYLSIQGVQTSSLITVPYNTESNRYEVELWGFPDNNLRDLLDVKGKDSLDKGFIQVRTDLIQGDFSDFNREGLDNKNMFLEAPSNTMHPVNPLKIDVAWTDVTETFWDSKNGENYQYKFNMIVRGWDNFLSVGVSPNPHGGTNFLHYRNLMSNYGQFADSNELGRSLEPWNFDANGNKPPKVDYEKFMSVDYIDLHVLKSSCGIGLHRHRDNQEIFFMMKGDGLMVVGDWAKFDDRERCFEIRPLKAGHFAMLKGGNLHALMNTTDEDISLFMFGGYD